MQGLDHEQFARVIAENVLSAFEHARSDNDDFTENERAMIVDGLRRALLATLPASSSEELATACNRYLAVLAQCGLFGLWVAKIDLVEGSVTIQST